MKSDRFLNHKRIIGFFVLFLVILGLTLFLFDFTENEKEKKNVILITVDALRSDHMSLYGYKRDTTPYLNNLSESSLVYKNAYSPSTWTLPSMSSIFTSKYPSEHSVIRGWDSLPRNLTSLQDILSSKGYRTIGISPFGFNRKGFNSTFEKYVFLEKGRRNAKSMTNTAIENLNTSKPFFLWLHYVDPHYPYFVPESVTGSYSNTSSMEWKCNIGIIDHDFWDKEENREYCTDLYDEEIKFVDSQIGRLIKKLKRKKLLKNSIIVITADHGEAFGEHGYYYHVDVPLYEEIIHVPLILKVPGLSARKIESEVDLTRITPTILEFLNISNSDINKKSLPSNNDEKESFAISEFIGIKKEYRAIIKDRKKYIHTTNSEDKFFDLKKDPNETTNLINQKLAQKYNETLRKALSYLGKNKKTEEALNKRLRELGYLN